MTSHSEKLKTFVFTIAIICFVFTLITFFILWRAKQTKNLRLFIMCCLLTLTGICLTLTHVFYYGNLLAQEKEENRFKIPLFIFFGLFKGFYQVLNWFFAYKYWIVSLTLRLLVKQEQFNEKFYRNIFVAFGFYLFIWACLDTLLFALFSSHNFGE